MNSSHEPRSRLFPHLLRNIIGAVFPRLKKLEQLGVDFRLVGSFFSYCLAHVLHRERGAGGGGGRRNKLLLFPIPRVSSPVGNVSEENLCQYRTSESKKECSN